MEHYSPELIVVSAEHGGREVPEAYASLFRNAEATLATHRGFDAGSAELAKALAGDLGVVPVIARVTRLLVDLNRSPGHPRQFSEFTRNLPTADRARLAAAHYAPHRRRVENLVRQSVACGGRAVHISVHSFTPVLGGKMRNADIALLYDPRRPAEVVLCERWAQALSSAGRDLKVRRNYPYKGTSDGLTTYLRRRLPDPQYCGVELEVNQHWVGGEAKRWQDLVALITTTTRAVLLGRAARE